MQRHLFSIWKRKKGTATFFLSPFFSEVTKYCSAPGRTETRWVKRHEDCIFSKKRKNNRWKSVSFYFVSENDETSSSLKDTEI